MPGAAAAAGVTNAGEAELVEMIAFGLGSRPPPTWSPFASPSEALVSAQVPRRARVVRKRPRAALAGIGDAARDAVQAREEIARAKGVAARADRSTRKAKGRKQKAANLSAKPAEKPAEKALEKSSEKASKVSEKAEKAAFEREMKGGERGAKEARVEKGSKVGEKERTRDGKMASAAGKSATGKSATGKSAVGKSATGSNTSNSGGSIDGNGGVTDDDEFFILRQPDVGSTTPGVVERAATSGFSPPGKATPSLARGNTGEGASSSSDGRTRENSGGKDKGGVESAASTSTGKIGSPSSSNGGTGISVGTGAAGGTTPKENDPVIVGGGPSSGAGSSDSASGSATPSPPSPAKATEKVVPVPGAPVGVDSDERAKKTTTGRVLAVRRVARAGAVVRREVSRIVTESAITAQMRMPTRREFAVFAWEAMLVVALITLLRTGVSRTLRWIHNRLDSSRQGLTKPSFPYEQSVFECLQRPLEMVSIFTVGTAAAEVLSRPLVAKGSNLLRYIRSLRELGVIFAATWFLLRWIDRIKMRFAVDKRIDKAQVDATSRVASVVTTVIAILISLDSVGVNVQTVLAFGGIGGVAIGFAGREIISNFFGGFMIFLTRPFSVGEWIRSIEEKDLNGTVEDIGWYLTRIRTWDKRPLYIPNSRFSTLIVENPSRMSNRRILHTLHLRLEDMPVVAKVVDSIDQLLKKHPELDPKQHRLAYVDSFDDFSVRIWMSCYTKSVFLFDWRRIQQELLLSVYGILREHGARLATTTTRDVRPGIDPDRYGPLGSAASFRNRRPATSSMPSGAGIAGSVRAAEEHLDGPHAPAIVAEIESGFAENELTTVPGSTATPAVSGPPRKPTGSAPTGAGVGAAPSSASGIARSGLTPGLGEGGRGGAAATANPIKGDDSTPAPPANAGNAIDADRNSKNGGKKSAVGAGKIFQNANISPSAAEALEMAAAAILAARYNQRRSDGRQSNAETVPSRGTGIAQQDSGSAVEPVDVGLQGTDTLSPNPSSQSPAAPEDGISSPIVAPLESGAGGDQFASTSGTSPTSTASTSGAAPPVIAVEATQPSGQMKISAAPPIGSSPSGSPPPRGPAQATAATGNVSGSTAVTPRSTAGSETARDAKATGGASETTAQTPSTSEKASSSSPQGRPKQSGSSSSAVHPANAPMQASHGQSGPGPSQSGSAAPPAMSSQASNTVSSPGGPATGQMNISAAPPKSKSKAGVPPSTPSTPLQGGQSSGMSDRVAPTAAKEPSSSNSGSGSGRSADGSDKPTDMDEGSSKAL